MAIHDPTDADIVDALEKLVADEVEAGTFVSVALRGLLFRFGGRWRPTPCGAGP